MTHTTPPIEEMSFGRWLRAAAWRAVKSGLVLLAIGGALVVTLQFTWPGFAASWTRFNSQLTDAALEQHPVAQVRAFAHRLGDSEYGWGVLSLKEPFNVSAAHTRLRHDFPEFLGVGPNGVPVMVQSTTTLRSDPQQTKARSSTYFRRYHLIESRRFISLYPPESPVNLPDNTTQLARLSTKVIGLPDALLFIGRRIWHGGAASVCLFFTVLTLAGVALLQSRRPARGWLKLLFWPWLASALVWLAILPMSVSSLLFGSFTTNTTALALLASLPLIHLGGRALLRFSEELAWKPKPWDGVERRRSGDRSRENR